MSRCRRCRAESTWICVTCHSRLRTGADRFGIFAASDREVDPCGTSFSETPGHTQLEKGRRSPSDSSRLRLRTCICRCQGSVANFVETEQLLCLSNGHMCSFVQLRGPIPVFWAIIPNVKYKPSTRLGREIDYTHAFVVHVNDLLRTYTVSKTCVVGGWDTEMLLDRNALR